METTTVEKIAGMFLLPHLAYSSTPHLRTTPPVSPHYPFFAFLLHQTLSFFTSVTFSVGGVSGLPCVVCTFLGCPWSEDPVAALSLSLSHGSTLKAQICRLDRRTAAAATHGPSSLITGKATNPTQPPISSFTCGAPGRQRTCLPPPPPLPKCRPKTAH